VIAFADAAVRTSLVLAAGLALAGLLRRRSAALRHGVLALTLLGALAVFPASRVLPSWTLTIPAAARVHSDPARAVTPVETAAAGESTPLQVPAAPSRPIGALVWTAGCAIVLAALFAGIARLRQIAGRGVPLADERWSCAARAIAGAYGLRGEVALLEADTPFGVATWGLRPARLMLPPGASAWSDARIRAVLSHELAHVARADWAIQIGSHVVVAALWFNPLAWLACRQLRRESELACDAAALEQGIEAADYAGHLVALARAGRRPSWPSWMPALPMARASAFERRITVMLNPRLDRRPLTRRLSAALAATLLAVTSVVASARAGHAQPTTLSGTLYDPSGGVIPGVTLLLSSAGQRTVLTTGGALTVTGPEGQTVTATTDSAGHYSFANVAAGRYVLSATLPGFRALHDEFDLKSDADWDRVVTLQVGTLRETINVSATRTFAAPAAAGPVPIRVGGNIRVPLKLQDVKPIYPESMRAEGRESNVELEATIARDGSVSAVHVVSTQIHPDFAIAAIDAVRQWRFSPTLLNGKPIEVVMTVTVRFSLSD
jgi:TonB family protein